MLRKSTALTRPLRAVISQEKQKPSGKCKEISGLNMNVGIATAILELNVDACLCLNKVCSIPKNRLGDSCDFTLATLPIS